MESEKKIEESPGTVFTSAQLVWLDEESGEVLEIEVVGGAPWVQELTEQGFKETLSGDQTIRRYHCRIELR